jgi:hypothetical protein
MRIQNVFSIILVNTFNPVVVLVVAVMGLAYDWLIGNDYEGDRLVMGVSNTKKPYCFGKQRGFQVYF